jgi:hypothetical protein
LAELNAHAGGAIVVYRPVGTPVTINGPSLTFEVKDGALVITSGGNPILALSSGQWLTVDFDPKTV